MRDSESALALRNHAQAHAGEPLVATTTRKRMLASRVRQHAGSSRLTSTSTLHAAADGSMAG